jgi:hypothetical protein
MLRKVINDRGGLVTDGWISVDPSEAAVIERVFKKTTHEGEKELMMAVLQDAVECFQTYVLSKRPREKRLFQEAEDWILEKNSDWFFSFENICEILELDPDYIRQGLICWKEAKRKIDSLPEQHRKSGEASAPETSVKPFTAA